MYMNVFIIWSDSKPLKMKTAIGYQFELYDVGLTEMYGANDVTGHTRVILMTSEVIHATVAMIDRLGQTHANLFLRTCFKIEL